MVEHSRYLSKGQSELKQNLQVLMHCTAHPVGLLDLQCMLFQSSMIEHDSHVFGSTPHHMIALDQYVCVLTTDIPRPNIPKTACLQCNTHHQYLDWLLGFTEHLHVHAMMSWLSLAALAWGRQGTCLGRSSHEIMPFQHENVWWAS